MQGTNAARGHLVDILFTLALFCVFAATALMVVVFGANVYEKNVQTMQDNFDLRTSMAYVSTKIRQNDTAGAIYLDYLDESTEALVLEQEFNGIIYQTWIYYYDGALRELFFESGVGFYPENGQEILRVRDFSLQQLDGGLLELSATDSDGQQSRLLLAPRCAS